jgi:hypothetical protein
MKITILIASLAFIGCGEPASYTHTVTVNTLTEVVKTSSELCAKELQILSGPDSNRDSELSEDEVTKVETLCLDSEAPTIYYIKNNCGKGKGSEK